MIIKSDPEMRALGRRLAEKLKPGDWVAIDGPLGAGKTVLCAGILSGFGFDGEVSSPSYAIVHPYDPPEVSIAVTHVDLYRLDNAEELRELGISDDREGRITLVEWAVRGGADFMMPSHRISITPQADGARLLTIQMDDNDSDR
jgi:tRNA threonylcarbamoyladenosine biosynthesis protein TsaE